MEIIECVMIRFGVRTKDLLFFYSGAKGFHCWVLDNKFFDYKPEQRAEILKVLTLKNTPECISDDIYNICDKWYNYVKNNIPNGARFLELRVKPQDPKEGILDLFGLKLDGEVTTGYNHLIKVPMALHPGSGNIATMIDNVTKKPLNYDESIIALKKMCH
jgi:DNA primase catalytic subunit